jgi:hypothetical protein
LISKGAPSSPNLHPQIVYLNFTTIARLDAKNTINTFGTLDNNNPYIGMLEVSRILPNMKELVGEEDLVKTQRISCKMMCSIWET